MAQTICFRSPIAIVNCKYMPRLFHSVGQLVEFIRDRSLPFDEDRCRIPAVLTQELHDLEQIVRRGPALFLSDLASLSSINTVGRPDLKHFPACLP